MSASDKLVYSGEKATFAGWKDKLKAHLMAKSDALEVTELQAGRQEPVARYEDALVRETVLPELKPDAADAEKGAYALQRAFVRRQASYVKDLLCQTLPSGAISEALMQRPVHVIWGSIEKRFGLNTASGVVELVQKFDAIINSDFKTLGLLFQELKMARDMANRNSRDALGTSLISQQFMLIKLLAVLSNHLWESSIKFTADEFTTEKVESSLCAIFGTKRRAEIVALGKGVHVNHVDAGAAKRPAPWGREKPGLSWVEMTTTTWGGAGATTASASSTTWPHWSAQ
ncbi:hypothetical protein PF008_g25608 [Phytophthora fragariae]|uniref:Uncharacterized protein n=1 Tax=Phytophthora fragariae TaxID=53985 RepID=A0A6G0QJH0_9STRA|nr:hypothetical protein PF008_g25608 [Phytophthora fragariae]